MSVGGTCFLDTSALVKLYVDEAGSADLQRRTAGLRLGGIYVSVLAGVEISSALHRLRRLGGLEGAAVARIQAKFYEDAGERFVAQPVNEAVLGTAADLLERYILRAYDAVQLASCLVIARSRANPVIEFISSDGEQLRAAEGEGLACYDPAVA